ncbi:hypothetical protein NL676_024329 [Syzygium grande]|nr:hypothetical protein NL676_024329 [Syzygium grande]
MMVLRSAAAEEADEGLGRRSQASGHGAWAVSSWTRDGALFPKLLPWAFWGGDWANRGWRQVDGWYPKSRVTRGTKKHLLPRPPAALPPLLPDGRSRKEIADVDSPMDVGLRKRRQIEGGG